MGREVPHLGGVLDLARAGRRRHQGGIDLRHQYVSVASRGGCCKSGLEWPDADVSAKRGIVAKRAEHGDAGQGLAAGGAGASELPAGLWPAHAAVDQAMLGKTVGAVPAVMPRLQERAGGARGAAPEWIGLAGEPAIEVGGH